MKMYVGLEGEGKQGLYLLSRKRFYRRVDDDFTLYSDDKDGVVAVCPAVWHCLGGTRVKPGESCCIDLTLTIKPAKKGA